MAKATILDRLAGAMETLGKREGKALTPRQRVAAAQRWNSLADIGETTADRMWDIDRDEFYKVTDELKRLGLDELPKAPPEVAARYKNAPLADSYDINRLDNPFLSDNIDKYEEQSEFLDWCRYKGLEPNGKTLKLFRWETYKTLPYRQRQWIANKDAVRDYLDGMYGYDRKELDRINTLDELEDYLQEAHPEDDWPIPYPMDDSPVFESMDEFPDDFDYMWRY